MCDFSLSIVNCPLSIEQTIMTESQKTELKIFLAGIIQGSLKDDSIHSQDWREPIRKLIDTYLPGSEVYCHYSAHPNSLTYTGAKIRRTFDDGVDRCKTSDLVFAYIPSASMGTAVEIYEAYRSGAIVLSITPMTANWVIKLYSHRVFANFDEIEKFFADGEFDKLMTQR